MKISSLFRNAASVLLLLGATVTSAYALPTPLVSPPVLVDGYRVDWAQTDTSPHSLADAINVLNGTGGFNRLNTATQYMQYVQLNDASVPFAGADPIFAIRVTGFITLGAGSYSFLSFHDDGIQIRVGGEEVVLFDSDTAPVRTDSAFYDLAAGVYEYEVISWEQGGQFALNLGIGFANGGEFFLAGQHAQVPEPLSLALVGTALLGLTLTRRRKN